MLSAGLYGKNGPAAGGVLSQQREFQVNFGQIQ